MQKELKKSKKLKRSYTAPFILTNVLEEGYSKNF